MHASTPPVRPAPATGAARRATRVRPWIARVALAAALLASGAPAASALPERFEARYALRAKGFEIGVTRWSLAPLEGGRFEYRSHSEAVGMAKLLRDERIFERSVWRFVDGSLRPLRYDYSRSGGKRERDVKVRFDWKRGEVVSTVNGESRRAPLAPGTLDKLVYQLALMRDLADGMREARYTVADGSKVKTYRLRVLRTERLDTVLGALDTVVVERSREDDERETLVWCAPALRYLPVRVEHREKDGTLYLDLTGVEGIALR